MVIIFIDERKNVRLFNGEVFRDKNVVVIVVLGVEIVVNNLFFVMFGLFRGDLCEFD